MAARSRVGPGHQRQRRRRAADLAGVDQARRHEPDLGLAALAAGLRGAGRSLHADPRVLLAGWHYSEPDLVRLRRRRRDDPVRRRDVRDHPGIGHGVLGHVPERRRDPGQRAGRHDRRRRAGATAISGRAQVHEPVPGGRRGRRGNRPADTRPGAAGVPRQTAARGAAARLHRRSAVAAMGATGRVHVPLDRELAYRVHDRGSRRERRADRRAAAGPDRPAEPPAPGGLRELRARSPVRVARPPDHRRRRLGVRLPPTSSPRSSRSCSRARFATARPGSSITRAGRSASRSSPARCWPPFSARPESPESPGSSTASAASSPHGRRCRRRSASSRTGSCASTTTPVAPRPARCA